MKGRPMKPAFYGSSNVLLCPECGYPLITTKGHAEPGEYPDTYLNTNEEVYRFECAKCGWEGTPAQKWHGLVPVNVGRGQAIPHPKTKWLYSVSEEYPDYYDILDTNRTARVAERISSNMRSNRYNRIAATADTSTEGLLDELLDILSGTNDLIQRLSSMEQDIHEAKADGEPVSGKANEVIMVAKDASGHLETARDILLKNLEMFTGGSSKVEEE